MGAIVFLDTSVFVAILTMEPDRSGFVDAIKAADRRMTSPVVRLETAIVLATRLGCAPREAEGQFDKFLADTETSEIDLTPPIGVAAVECFERFGEGRHPARLNFADCLSYAAAKAFGARLLFKGEDFARTDVNSWLGG